MPITKGAEKKLRQDKKRERSNLAVKQAISRALSKFRKSPTEKQLSQVYSLLDTSAKKKIYHKNKIARLKSRLTKRITAHKNPKTAKKSK